MCFELVHVVLQPVDQRTQLVALPAPRRQGTAPRIAVLLTGWTEQRLFAAFAPARLKCRNRSWQGGHGSVPIEEVGLGGGVMLPEPVDGVVEERFARLEPHEGHPKFPARDGGRARPGERVEYQAGARDAMQANTSTREFHRKRCGMWAIPVAVLDGRIRDEPRGASVTQVSVTLAPSRDVGLVAVGHADGVLVERDIAALRQMKHKFMASGQNRSLPLRGRK